MKTVPAGLLTSETLCVCLKVERADGEVVAFTSADHDVVVDGLTYLAATGLEVSNLVVQGNFSVDNMELTVLPDETSYPQVDIIAGLWDNAKFRLFECDYTNPGLGTNLLKRGTTGDADTLRSTRRFEFRGLKQALQQQIVEVTSKTCRYRLGDDKCLVDLGPWTHTYAITSVTSRHIFTCSAATEVSDYYGEGIAYSVGSDDQNVGYSRKIKSFAAGVFTLSIEFPFTVSIGDEFTFVAGCRKRLLEDCKAKFDNVLNFGGEPHVPGADLFTADPEIA